MKNYLLTIALLCYLPSLAIQQDDKKLSKKKLIEQADYHFFKENFTKATELYSSLMKNYPKNHYVQYHAFVAYHLSEGRGSDMSALKEYEENEGRTDKFYNYWLGRIHYQRYDFEVAEEHFKSFLNMDIYRTNEIKKETEGFLAQTRKAKAFYNKLNDFEVQPMATPINSEYTDISPAFYSNHSELLFVSSRPFSSTSEEEFRIFHSIKSGEEFSEPKPITSVGTLDENNTKIEVVNNDGRLFMYKEDNGGDLFYSEPNEGEWGKPKEFNTKLRNHLVESHFFINSDETIIYFAAKGEKGDLDIYQSKFDPSSNSWNSPVAILGEANSKYNDDNPFLTEDGQTLYFSSDRPESIGGYDVFKSEVDPTTGFWSKPVNVGFPINTIDDDINFQLNKDNISGFLSSNRLHGKGGFDIYYFHKQGKVLVSGKVYDKNTNKSLAQAKVTFHPMKYQDESFSTTTDKYGNYQKEIFQNEDFKVEIYLGNEKLYSEQVRSSHDEHKKSFEKDFYIDVPEQLSKVTDFASLYEGSSTSKDSYEKLEMIGSKFRSGEKVLLNNIYFDLHSIQVKSESIPTLEKIKKIMSNNPDLRIEIGGHTCDIGSHETNMNVSLSRAENVKSYLVKQGIDDSRLIAKGYGETLPLASNDDEEEGRELNRRIELRVVR